MPKAKALVAEECARARWSGKTRRAREGQPTLEPERAHSLPADLPHHREGILVILQPEKTRVRSGAGCVRCR